MAHIFCSVCAIQNFIEFLIDFCTYDDILDTIQITDKKLSHFKLSKLGQILCVDKTCFPGPVTIYGVMWPDPVLAQDTYGLQYT